MNTAFNLIENDLKLVERQFRRNLDSDVPLIQKVGDYILSSGGKRIRPALLLLAARLCGYTGDKAVSLASIIEFVHTATLLHDDVVDRAAIRRGFASANTLWGNEASVLVGDFLFSKSFSLVVDMGNTDVLRVFSKAATVIAEGEVKQLLSIGDLNLTEESYLKIARAKTAVLMSAACEIGGILGNASQETRKALSDFGMELGTAFQLVDDALDYIANEKEFGKTIGHDLKERKITLPLIHTLKNCSEDERDYIAETLTKEEMLFEDFKNVSLLIKRTGGIDYTLSVARKCVDECGSYMDVFKESPEREAMLDLSEYVITRSR